MQISGKAIIMAHVVGDTEEMLTLEIPKSRDHKFQLSDDKFNNRFYGLLFVKNYERSLEPFVPKELEGLYENN